ncbi:proton-transporting V-type ATPase complex assembly regulator TMEM9-like isoform X2 [Pectinophora gossypiella]|uniref:proton-transporting V-type ATPase complex assembly regulator TMEM9-like isoform X2 n=1 Tax=Pectinophora gossypiella TaxID=13191 RepID=UPI00214E6976|nr:proton-transporting V-type ATPase complex assembly regulator TMEM9-like isoform X2 [Pectinophora gossypiella]
MAVSAAVPNRSIIISLFILLFINTMETGVRARLRGFQIFFGPCCSMRTRLSKHAQHHEDKRCRCVCPSPAAVLNSSLSTDRKLFIANVPPSQCNCDGVILPRVGDEIKGHEQEFCPRCECKYESRNTTVIMVVVVIVVWLTTMLFVYMMFLMCLDPLINKKKVKLYQEYESEGEEELRKWRSFV